MFSIDRFMAIWTFVMSALIFIGLPLVIIFCSSCGESQPPIEDRIAYHALLRHGEIGQKVWDARHSNTEIYEVAKKSGLYKDHQIYGWNYPRIAGDLTDGMFTWFPFRHQCIGIAHSRYRSNSSPELFHKLIWYARENNIEFTNKEYKHLQKKCGL